MAFFQDSPGKPARERQTILDFTQARDDGVAVAPAGPYTPHSRQIPCHYLTTQSFYRLDALPAAQPSVSNY